MKKLIINFLLFMFWLMLGCGLITYICTLLGISNPVMYALGGIYGACLGQIFAYRTID